MESDMSGIQRTYTNEASKVRFALKFSSFLRRRRGRRDRNCLLLGTPFFAGRYHGELSLRLPMKQRPSDVTFWRKTVSAPHPRRSTLITVEKKTLKGVIPPRESCASFCFGEDLPPLVANNDLSEELRLRASTF